MNIMTKANEEKTQEQITAEEIQAKIEKQEETINNLISEIQELRTKKTEAEKAAEELLKAPKEDDDETQKAVNKALELREQKQIESFRQQAEQEFRNSKSDIHPENDAAGIKFNAFKRELSKFSFDGLQTKQEFIERLNEVYDFYKRKNPTEDNGSKLNKFGGTPESKTIKADESNLNLSKSEVDFITDKGWSKERYLKLKDKQPEFINQLLKQAGII